MVTGAAGFIASRVCELLLAEGHNVTGIDNLIDAEDVRIKHWRLQRLQSHPAFHFLQVDICDRPGLERTAELEGPFEAVLNLAARAGVGASVENPWVYVETNLTCTLNLLELCRQRGIPKFILASTSSCFHPTAGSGRRDPS